MTRTLVITAAEMSACADDGTVWVARPHARPPADLQAVAAPCPQTWCDGGTVLDPEWEGWGTPCPDCLVELRCSCARPDGCDECGGTGILGHAYAVGGLICVEPERVDEGTTTNMSRWVETLTGHTYMHPFVDVAAAADILAACARYGDFDFPAHTVWWALKLRVVSPSS